jgi:hypothetical protein
MKIILRDAVTGLYWGGNQTWHAEASGALDFDSIQIAARLAQEQRLETVNVVLRYEMPTCELALPLARLIEFDNIDVKHEPSPILRAASG